MRKADQKLLDYIKQPLVKHRSKMKDVKIEGYKLYYGDGFVFTAKGSYLHLFKEWHRAPFENIQIIMLYENKYFGADKKHYRMSISGFDYYLFDGIDFMACNDTRKFSLIPKNSLKYGWYMDKEKFKEINEKAIMDFWLKGES